jgi:hypothetical protein
MALTLFLQQSHQLAGVKEALKAILTLATAALAVVAVETEVKLSVLAQLDRASMVELEPALAAETNQQGAVVALAQ